MLFLLGAAAYSLLFAFILPSPSTYLPKISEKDRLEAKYLVSAPIHIQVAHLIFTVYFLFSFLFGIFHADQQSQAGACLATAASLLLIPTPFLPFFCRTFRLSHFFPLPFYSFEVGRSYPGSHPPVLASHL